MSGIAFPALLIVVVHCYREVVPEQICTPLQSSLLYVDALKTHY